MAVGTRLPIHFDWFPNPVVVADAMDTAATRIHDIRVPLARSVEVVVGNVKSHFDRRGPGWAPWAVEGRAGPAMPYSKTYVGSRLLRKSGALYEHATSPGSYRIAANTITYIPSGVKDEVFSVPGPYYRNIFERPFMGLDERGIAGVEAIFFEWIGEVTSMIQSGGRGEMFSIGGRTVFRPRSSLGTFLPGGRG